MSRFLSSLLVIGLLAAAAPANVVFEWEATTEPGVIGGGYAPTGYKAYDLYMTVDNNVAQVQMYAQATPSTTGTFYQHTYGTNWTPQTFIITDMGYLELEFDTYLTMPVSGSAGGAAINVVTENPLRSPTFDDQLLDMMWAVSGGANSGPGKFLVARVTVPDPKVVGTWAIWGQETGPLPLPEYTASGDGPLFIPEPATVLVLLGGALLAAIRRW